MEKIEKIGTNRISLEKRSQEIGRPAEDINGKLIRFGRDE
jgi:hypothetical protein